MVGLYGKTLNRAFHYPKVILMIAVLCMSATVFLFSRLPVNLIPSEDRGFFFAFVNLPAGLAPVEVSVQQKNLDALIRTNQHIEKFLSLNFGDNLVYLASLKHLSERPPQPQIINEIQETIDAIPGTQTFIQPYQLLNLDLDLGNAGQYQYVIRGLEFADVENAALELTKELQSHPEISFVRIL